MNKIGLILITLLITISTTKAEVWVAGQNWDEQWESRWSHWVESENFKRDIFFSTDSPYYNFETDCADALIALRAIFSFKNKLPFSIRLNQKGTRVSNKSSKFDNEANPLKGLIEYIGQQIGTDALARYNTYPIAFNDLRAGDFYFSKWQRKGKWLFHSEIIKKILDTGHLMTYYSTSPVSVRRLARREGFPAHSLYSKPFGFRRFLREDQNYSSLSNYEQYSIYAQNPERFFSRLSETIKKREDTFNENIKRRIGNLCRSLEDRKHEVNSALRYLEKVGGRCLSKSEFHAYSTPSRDGTLYKDLNRLMNGWKKIRKTHISDEIDLDVKLFLDYLIRKDKSLEAEQAHQKLCNNYTSENKIAPINYTLKNFFDRKYKKRLSPHPNDSFEARWWGTGSKTNCPNFY